MGAIAQRTIGSLAGVNPDAPVVFRTDTPKGWRLKFFLMAAVFNVIHMESLRLDPQLAGRQRHSIIRALEPFLHPIARHIATFWAWAIETYHRGLEQCCGVEKAQVRSARTQTAYSGFAIRALLRPVYYRLCTGLSCYEAKTFIFRSAIRQKFTNPFCTFPSTS